MYRDKTILVGTRSSRLAKWQAQQVINQLKGIFNDHRFQLVDIRTRGDASVFEPFTFSSEYDIFSREVEKALECGDIDIAVHSMRDLPYNISPKLTIGAVVSRSEPADVLISNDNISLDDLPEGAKIGTSSFLRRAQLLKYRSDFNVLECRGYITDRLNRLRKKEMDAIVLAAASVERLGLEDVHITEYLPYSIFMPAAGQGTIGVEVRKDNKSILDMVKMLHNMKISRATIAERTVIKHLGGKRHFPIGSLAQFEKNRLRLEAIVLSYDGRESVRAFADGDPFDCEKIGVKVAEKLLNRGADKILEKMQ